MNNDDLGPIDEFVSKTNSEPPAADQPPAIQSYEVDTCVRFGEIAKTVFSDNEESALLRIVKPEQRWDSGRNRLEKIETNVHLLRGGEIGAFIGAGGCGKSMALLQLCILIAAAESGESLDDVKWLGSAEILKGGPVLYLTAEDSAQRTRDRVIDFVNSCRPGGLSLGQREAIARNLRIEPYRPDSQRLTTTAEGKATEYCSKVTEALRDDERGYKLIILDPLSEIGDPETEMNNAIGRATIQGLRRMASEVSGNPCVIVTHHTGKESQGNKGQREKLVAMGGRGSSSIGDTCRFVIYMESDVYVEGISDGARSLLGRYHPETFKHEPQGQRVRIDLGMKDNSETGFLLKGLNPYFMDRSMGGYIRKIKSQDIISEKKWKAHTDAAQEVFEEQFAKDVDEVKENRQTYGNIRAGMESDEMLAGQHGMNNPQVPPPESPHHDDDKEAEAEYFQTEIIDYGQEVSDDR